MAEAPFVACYMSYELRAMNQPGSGTNCQKCSLFNKDKGRVTAAGPSPTFTGFPVKLHEHLNFTFTKQMWPTKSIKKLLDAGHQASGIRLVRQQNLLSVIQNLRDYSVHKLFTTEAHRSSLEATPRQGEHRGFRFLAHRETAMGKKNMPQGQGTLILQQAN
jgi:hypothetical protein